MALDRSRLLAIFGEELEDRRRDLERGLLGLDDDPDPARLTELVAELFRAAHSLKGAAHSAGVPSIAKVAHDLEDLFAQLRSSGQSPAPRDVHAALAAIDELDELALTLHTDDPSEQRTDVSRPHDRDLTAADGSGPRAGPQHLRARVASEHLDTAMTAAGELHLEVSAVADFAGTLGRLALHARGLERVWEEADASTRDRHAAPAAGERFGSSLQQLTALAVDAEQQASAREHQLRLAADEVRHAVQQLGLVPFEEVCVGLDRVVRDVAAAAGKYVRLEVATGTLELDRTVAAVLRDPLFHLVRNAVDHGLEAPDVRTRAGKPPEGRVTIAAELEAGQLVVTVSDDGTGLDADSIRRTADERGLDLPPLDEDLARVLFVPGFSTRSTPTDVSGRGVGLDVVRTSIEAVGGSVDIRAAADHGLAVRMRLPLTLSTMRAVVVRVEKDVVALPVTAVERAGRLGPEDVTTVDGHRMAIIDDRPVPLSDLGAVLGFGPERASAGTDLVVVLRTADGEAAVVVDEVMAEQELWVRSLPPRLQTLRGLLGGAVLVSGRCALLLNPATLVRAVRRRDGASSSPRPGPTTPERPRILLAEDTVTTRMLEQSILEAAGYEVTVAVDGHDAWRRLQDVGADLVVTDVDMPRMNGFELCSTIRSSPRFSHIPVVLVTSLADDRDRARGLEAGADAYFVKSAFDQTSLLNTVARLL